MSALARCARRASDSADTGVYAGDPTGEVDAILENWGHEDLAAKYITTDKTAQDAGQTGNEGIIGWYIPKFFADANPDILTTKTNPQILNKYADQFKTSESGDKGQFLGSDPTFVQYDEALIANLGLNYKDVFSGSEAATITAFQQADKNKTPSVDPLIQDGQRLIPSVTRVFSRSRDMYVYLQAYEPEATIFAPGVGASRQIGVRGDQGVVEPLAQRRVGVAPARVQDLERGIGVRLAAGAVRAGDRR